MRGFFVAIFLVKLDFIGIHSLRSVNRGVIGVLKRMTFFCTLGEEKPRSPLPRNGQGENMELTLLCNKVFANKKANVSKILMYFTFKKILSNELFI